MIKRGILLLFLWLANLSVQGASILDRVITIEIKSAPVHVILTTIEENGGVQFSYNPNLIDENRMVSLSLKNKTIRYGLELIFDNTVRFKEVGNHIVLLPSGNPEEEKARKKEHEYFVFTGTITDARSLKPIRNASIYEVEAHSATLSDEKGDYNLKVPISTLVKTLYISKEGYEPQVIVLDGSSEAERRNNISLVPLLVEVEKIDPTQVEKIDKPVEEKGISTVIIPQDVVIHGNNLKEIEETRMVQISLIPAISIGSDLSTNSLVVNHFSFNILGGYSKGVKGAEIGSIVNLVKEDVEGVQIGGLANLVGGNVTGVQVGGISNLVQGEFKGAQVGGISSILKRDMTGAQVSGVASITRGGFYGVQVSGVSNIVRDRSVGLQVSGVYNQAEDTIFGGQVSGIANVSGGVSLMQICGISNYSGTNSGLQISGIFNFAKENKGFQIGLINTSIRSKGVSLGLFNFVKEGYHKTEISANEIFPLNLVFKSGTRHFYNTYNFGVRFGEVNDYACGLGFGSYFDLTEKWSLSLDLSGQMVFENNLEEFKFAQLYKSSLTADWHLAKWLTLFAGPTINVNVIQFKDEFGGYSSDIHFHPIDDHQFNSGRSLVWIGGQFGIRL